MERRETTHDRDSAARARKIKRERELRIMRISFCICLLVVFVAGAVILLLMKENRQTASNNDIITENNTAVEKNKEEQSGEKSADEILEELIQAMQDARNIDTSVYTDESVQNLTQRCQEAQDMMDRRTYTLEELKVANENMSLALEALQRK